MSASPTLSCVHKRQNHTHPYTHTPTHTHTQQQHELNQTNKQNGSAQLARSSPNLLTAATLSMLSKRHTSLFFFFMNVEVRVSESDDVIIECTSAFYSMVSSRMSDWLRGGVDSLASQDLVHLLVQDFRRPCPIFWLDWFQVV